MVLKVLRGLPETQVALDPRGLQAPLRAAPPAPAGPPDKQDPRDRTDLQENPDRTVQTPELEPRETLDPRAPKENQVCEAFRGSLGPVLRSQETMGMMET